MKVSCLSIFGCLLLLFSAAAANHEHSTGTSIVFATLGGSFFSFDIFALPTKHSPTPSNEIKLTDGKSINFNGHFPSSSPPNQTSPHNLSLVYVTEREGVSNIYYDAVYYSTSRSRGLSRSALEVDTRVQVPLLKGITGVSMKDKPSLVGDYLVYVSTHEQTNKLRTSWAAVYSTELTTGLTRRLTPYGIADFSPAVSPSGTFTAVASYAEKGWDGEAEELSTDIYVFLTWDGAQRVKVVEHGGWPSWVDDSTIYFHRRSEKDGWISVYRAILPSHGRVSTESVIVERVTPPGLHAFTAATSPGNNEFIAVSTRRPNSSYRHIELFNLVKNEFTELTRLVSPKAHHLNPFLSPDSGLVGYHRCRGPTKDLFLENIRSPESDISLFRIDGSFASFSPAGDRIAFVDFPGVFVVNRDGSNRRQVHPDMAFSTEWDPVRPGVIYTNIGPTFASETTKVDIISIDVDAKEGVNNLRKLTFNGQNNAFPSVSPDGKQIVFRSALSGHKNLYIMDAIEGENGGLQRLTEGAWVDTMCVWSPDGEWIVFASDRENPGSVSFELYLIHPNGTGLRKLVPSGSGGRANHPSFSPDGKRVVFTSDYAGISAEPISNPHQYQPYGEIYTVNLDGSDLKRLSHNSFEDGTPAWSREYITPVDVEWPEHGPWCPFEECHWLNEMPSNNVGEVFLNSKTPQCCACACAGTLAGNT